MLEEHEKQIIDIEAELSKFEIQFEEHKKADMEYKKKQLRKCMIQKNVLSEILNKIEAKELSLDLQQESVLIDVCHQVIKSNLIDILNLKYL